MHIHAELARFGLSATHYHDESAELDHDAFLLDMPGYLENIHRRRRPASPVVGASDSPVDSGIQSSKRSSRRPTM